MKNETYGWEEGKVIAWDGSFDHSVDCMECKQDRIILMVRYMHPGITRADYGSVPRTHFEEVREEMFHKGETLGRVHEEVIPPPPK